MHCLLTSNQTTIALPLSGTLTSVLTQRSLLTCQGCDCPRSPSLYLLRAQPTTLRATRMCSRLKPRKSRNKKTAGGWYEGLSKMDALTSKKGTVTAADMMAVYRYGLQVDNLVLVEAQTGGIQVFSAKCQAQLLIGLEAAAAAAAAAAGCSIIALLAMTVQVSARRAPH